MIIGELADGGVGVVGVVKLNNACALGASIGFVLYLRLLDLTDGLEKLDQVVVAGGPR